MYKEADAKRAYFQERYRNNKERYKKTNENYWLKYAQQTLGKEDVTEDEIRQCRNAYYRDYRKNNKAQVDKNIKDFWKRKVDEANGIQK